MTSESVLCGDALALFADVPDASIDCIVTDPPYGETNCAWDSRVGGWMREARRVLKPQGSVWIFGSMRFFMESAGEFSGWKMAQDVVWEKHNGSNSFADRFRRVHEHALQFYPDTTKWADVYKVPPVSLDAQARTVRRKQKAQHWSKIAEGNFRSVDGGPRLVRSVVFCRSEHGRALHPTQKPVGILGLLIEYSCAPGGIVLDPFCGSGSTGVAALRNGRGFIGFELNKEYAEIARARLEDDQPMFNAVARPIENMEHVGQV